MIRQAEPADLETVRTITHDTIRAVYPHYYPAGAVEYFLAHHSKQNIEKDIAAGAVWLCCDENGCAAGTVTVCGNELNRLFVLPAFQGKGYGRELLDFAENRILSEHPAVVLSASFPAKQIYLNRGYHTESYHKIETPEGDFLCYDEMLKNRTE